MFVLLCNNKRDPRRLFAPQRGGEAPWGKPAGTVPCPVGRLFSVAGEPRISRRWAAISVIGSRGGSNFRGGMRAWPISSAHRCVPVLPDLASLSRIAPCSALKTVRTEQWPFRPAAAERQCAGSTPGSEAADPPGGGCRPGGWSPGLALTGRIPGRPPRAAGCNARQGKAPKGAAAAAPLSASLQEYARQPHLGSSHLRRLASFAAGRG